MSSENSLLGTFTPEQIDGLRDAILKHDNETRKNSFLDLSKPVPNPMAGRFQKFPMDVYKHEGSTPAKDVVKPVKVNGLVSEETVHVLAKYVTKRVGNEEELKAALESGYREDVPVWDENGKLLSKKSAKA